MGQWAARSRRGGKKTPPTELAQIARAILVDEHNVTITYNQNAPTVQLEPEDFTSAPSAAQPTFNIDDTPNGLTLLFEDDITGDTAIAYAGTTPGFITPNVKTYG